jgi:SAM-dependent methyltransferase
VTYRVSSWTDHELLSDQYRSDENLHARQAIYTFQQPCIDLPEVVVGLLDAKGNEVVVDVGCGNGRYLSELKRRRHTGPVIGVDMSFGMLVAARDESADAMLVCGDGGALPVRSGRANLALVMHMLYHVPEPGLAVKELRRVTANAGRVLVGLNGDDHLQELRAAIAATAADFGLRVEGAGERLSLADGEKLMRAAFPTVVRHDFESELVVPGPAPVESYLRSTITMKLLPEAQRNDYVAGVLGHLPISDKGEFRVKTHSGCLVCS